MKKEKFLKNFLYSFDFTKETMFVNAQTKVNIMQESKTVEYHFNCTCFFFILIYMQI